MPSSVGSCSGKVLTGLDQMTVRPEHQPNHVYGARPDRWNGQCTSYPWGSDPRHVSQSVASFLFMTNQANDYFRRDQTDGLTAPDLSKICTEAEHIVRARGKRTSMTSVSLDPKKIDDFGPSLYQAIRPCIEGDGHTFIEHGALLEQLRKTALSTDKAERARAIQAQRYAKRRLEGLVAWKFDWSSIERKDLITWSFKHIQKYFQKV